MISPRILLFICSAAYLLCGSLSLAGATCWQGGSSTWNTPGNWSSGLPANGVDTRFDDSAGCDAAGTTYTINLGNCTRGTCCFIVENQTQNYIFTFTCGTVRPTNCSNINGTAIFTCGGKLTSSGATGKIYNVGACNGSVGTLKIIGACSDVIRGKMYVGNANNSYGTLVMDGAGTSTLDQFALATSACSKGYALIKDTNLTLCGCANLDVVGADGSEGTIVFCGATFTSNGDIDLGVLNSGNGRNTKGWMYVNCSTLTINEDFMITQPKGEGTAVISGACTTFNIGGGMVVGKTCTDPGYLQVTDCASVIVSHGNVTGSQESKYGVNGVTATIKICDGGHITINDGAKANTCQFNVGDCTVIILDGGRHSGTSGILFQPGAIMRGDRFFGNGVWENDIELNGGTFNDGTCAGATLVLKGDITKRDAADVMRINGAGTIAIGDDNIIADNIDIQLNGGTLSTGEEDPGPDTGSNETVANLTLFADSTIELGTGAHDFEINGMLDLDTYTLTISGWQGTAGNSGTAGRLLVDTTLPTGWSAGDNGGAGFDGINWGGGVTKSMVLVDGSLWEIVPFSTVPETSTWLSVGGIAAVISSHQLLRRRRCKHLQLD